MQNTSKQLPLLASDISAKSAVYIGDALQVLSGLSADIVQTAITSPPYWGLRDYESNGQIGSEEKVEDYIKQLVNVFRELRRVLKEDGTSWLNIGDTYTSGGHTRIRSTLILKVSKTALAGLMKLSF